MAEDHKGRGALAEALADVGARGFLAHRVKIVLAEDLLDLVETRAGRGGAHADPLGLCEPFGRNERDRNARLRHALLFFEGRHLSISRAIRRAAPAPPFPPPARTPRARGCVSPRPG